MTENKLLGSCRTCGQHIWINDYTVFRRPIDVRKNEKWEDADKLRPMYKCILCKVEWFQDEIIPF
jgi:hypothetical protein